MALPPDSGAPSTPSSTYASAATGNTSGFQSASVQQRQTIRAQTTAADASSGTSLLGNASSFGLERPFLDWRVFKTADETTPPDATTSGTFVALFTASAEPQHPKIRVRVKAVGGAGTSGEVRLRDRVTGQVIAGPLVVGSGATVTADLEGALVNPTLAGAGAPMLVDVEVRRTGGVNTVALHVYHALGKGEA